MKVSRIPSFGRPGTMRRGAPRGRAAGLGAAAAVLLLVAACQPTAVEPSFEPLPSFGAGPTGSAAAASPSGASASSPRASGSSAGPTGGQQDLFYLEVLEGGYNTFRFAYRNTVTACVTEPDPDACRTTTERALSDAERLLADLQARDAELAALLETDLASQSDIAAGDRALREALRSFITAFEARLASLAADSDEALVSANQDAVAAARELAESVVMFGDGPFGLRPFEDLPSASPST
jgi:hypothetical protein